MSTPAAAFVPLARLPLGAGSRVDDGLLARGGWEGI